MYIDTRLRDVREAHKRRRRKSPTVKKKKSERGKAGKSARTSAELDSADARKKESGVLRDHSRDPFKATARFLRDAVRNAGHVFGCPEIEEERESVKNTGNKREIERVS